MAKHTSGPWKVMHKEASKDYIRIRGTVLGEKYKIANALSPEFSQGRDAEADANARLIAAAPTMLEALKGEVCSAGCPETCCGKLRAAIKLAEGEL